MTEYISANLANKASTDLSGKDGLLVKNDSGLALCSAVTDIAIGVIVKGGVTSSDVCLFGKVPMYLGGTVTALQGITATSDGSGIVDAGTSARKVVAFALEAGVSGDMVNVMFTGAYPIVTFA